MRPSETSDEAVRGRKALHEVLAAESATIRRAAAVRAEQADLVARWERLDELIEIERRYVALEAEVTRLREVVRAWSRVLVGRGLARPDEVLRAVQGVSGVPSREELEDLWAPWHRIGS